MPTNQVYRYNVQLKGVDSVPPTMSEVGHNVYNVRDPVWIKASHNQCTTTFRKGGITGLVSLQPVLVDRIPCHVRDISPISISQSSISNEDDMSQSEDEILISVNKSDDPTEK